MAEVGEEEGGEAVVMEAVEELLAVVEGEEELLYLLVVLEEVIYQIPYLRTCTYKLTSIRWRSGTVQYCGGGGDFSGGGDRL